MHPQPSQQAPAETLTSPRPKLVSGSAPQVLSHMHSRSRKITLQTGLLHYAPAPVTKWVIINTYSEAWHHAWG